jgi:hypothetical protein
MKAKHAFSTLSDTAAAVREIAGQLPAKDTRLLVYFASPRHAPSVLASAMSAAFPGVPSLGCSTAGEIVSGRMLDHSLVAMALGSDLVRRAFVQPLQHIGAGARAAVGKAFAAFEREFAQPMAALDSDKHVGLVLADGLSGAEEHLMDAIGDSTNVAFVGGSAGDDLQFQRTHLFAGDRVFSNAAVLAVIEAAAPFTILKTQSFRVLSKKLVATKVNESRRQVIEFDGRPAVDAYAAALGIDAGAVSGRFMSNPVGLIVDGDAFVRSPQRVEGGSIFFYCSILEGTELSLLESTNIVDDTARALGTVRRPAAIVNFNCILRTLELKQKNLCEAYGKVFSGVPTVGFSTYGEEYLGHINQTATMLVFEDS